MVLSIQLTGIGMFKCYTCKLLFSSVSLLCSHMYRHDSAGELVYPVRCWQGTCTSTFRTIYCLRRHLLKFHSSDQNSSISVDSVSVCPSTAISYDDRSQDNSDVVQLTQAPAKRKFVFLMCNLLVLIWWPHCMQIVVFPIQ